MSQQTIITTRLHGKCSKQLKLQFPNESNLEIRSMIAAIEKMFTQTDLLHRYYEPWRHYHRDEHIIACLQDLFAVHMSLSPTNRIRVFLALTIHDSVYDPQNANNEERSAEYGYYLLSAHHVLRTVADDVSSLVLSSKDHILPQREELHTAAKIFLDCDLAILGASSKIYQEYAKNIRREYHWYSSSDYAQGRAEIMQDFLDREKIYLTKYFCAKYEVRARNNIAREISQLQNVI